MGNVIEHIEHVDQQTASIVSSVNTQSDSTTNISHNIQSTATGTQRVSDSINQISDIADQSVTISTTLDETSKTLLSGAENLETTLTNFLSKMKQQS